jgi:hypothetical protein
MYKGIRCVTPLGLELKQWWCVAPPLATVHDTVDAAADIDEPPPPVYGIETLARWVPLENRNPDRGRICESPRDQAMHGYAREGQMAREDAALKDWCRSRINDSYREAYRLSLEVGLQAQEKEDLTTLAQAIESLDSAVELLQRTRKQLVEV